ncbi:NAD(P)/FAD-dependent oxidoreductase [Winogradskyella maritima]|uniref:NAD(P)/FAD-dependent oxidoreductase n=1 Tax=Winogradskyella maritima TaxID=1517766 RepID=A0ABV8AHA8_9FLAO
MHLANTGVSDILLMEKISYPNHKVCGEYVSNEVLPYLKSFGFNPFDFGAKDISKFELTTHNNKTITAQLPLGGFGMSRYELDFQLYKLVIKAGVEVLQDVVENVEYEDDYFKIKTQKNGVVTSHLVIGAYGKRSSLDVKFQRKFIQKKSPYLAVKTHVAGDFPEDKVALHNFEGGYCGVSKVENNHINLCYITSFEAFKKFKTIEDFQEQVLFKNKELNALFSESKPQFENPLTISQISFETKPTIENHMLMCGDTAGMIHPLCGNGMGMAIRSAQLASSVIIDYLQGKIKTRKQLENTYSKAWKQQFSFRLNVGHGIAYLFRQNWLAPKLLLVLRWFPFLLPKIIRMTHGSIMRPVRFSEPIMSDIKE